MIVVPKGTRNSDPIPVASARGSAPNMRGHRRHQNGPKTQQARLVNRALRVAIFVPLRRQGKVDH